MASKGTVWFAYHNVYGIGDGDDFEVRVEEIPVKWENSTDLMLVRHPTSTFSKKFKVNRVARTREDAIKRFIDNNERSLKNAKRQAEEAEKLIAKAKALLS